MRAFEIPVIMRVVADDRAAAEDRASDIADALDSVWNDVSGVAVVARDHNVLDRLGIEYDGEEVAA